MIGWFVGSHHGHRELQHDGGQSLSNPSFMIPYEDIQRELARRSPCGFQIRPLKISTSAVSVCSFFFVSVTFVLVFLFSFSSSSCRSCSSCSCCSCSSIVVVCVTSADILVNHQLR